MGRGKKSLSHQLGKITTRKVAMSSQPDAERGGNPSLCRRKGGLQLWIRMLRALQRFVLHWGKSAKTPWGFFLSPILHFPFGGGGWASQHTWTLSVSILNPSLLLYSSKVRLILLGHFGDVYLVHFIGSKQIFCSHLPNAHWLTCCLIYLCFISFLASRQLSLLAALHSI